MVYPSSIPDVRQGRAQVDAELAGFYAGTMFYTFLPVNIAAEASLTVKLARTCNIIIRQFRLELTAGDYSANIYRGGTESGTWTAGTVYPRNAMTNRPAPTYASQASVGYGGTVAGGTLIDQLRVKVSGASGQATSVGQTNDDMYGGPAGTAYYVLTNNDSGAGVGFLHILWEELP